MIKPDFLVRKGHLFENRYKSILCDEDNYLLALVRYIHLNPIRAKIIQTMAELDTYPWSGHRAIIEKEKFPWMDIATVWTQFGDTKRKAIEGYRQFMLEGSDQGHGPQFLEADLSEASGDGPTCFP